MRDIMNAGDSQHFPLELLGPVDTRRRDDAVLHTVENARDKNQLGAAGHGADDVVRNAMEKIDLARYQCGHRRVALNPDQLHVKSLALKETGVLRQPQRQDGAADETVADAELVGRTAA